PCGGFACGPEPSSPPSLTSAATAPVRCSRNWRRSLARDSVTPALSSVMWGSSKKGAPKKGSDPLNLVGQTPFLVLTLFLEGPFSYGSVSFVARRTQLLSTAFNRPPKGLSSRTTRSWTRTLAFRSLARSGRFRSSGIEFGALYGLLCSSRASPKRP